jgi:stress response protein SCP2
MKSGVSKILLKGETYSAAPNLKHIQMLERWRFDGDTIFLDASCLIYDFSGSMLGVVDYSNTEWHSNTSRHSADPCVRHSGDVIGNGTGEHTISIFINRLPNTVASLFFTVSAWTTTLREVSQPSAHLHDVESDTEMCRYKMEDTNTGDKTAVIMCKLHRPSPKDRWSLTTIGHVGYGRADNYFSIEQDIKKYL